VSAQGATLELCNTIARAGPFGAGNPEPVLALPSHTVAYAEEVGQAHVRVRLKSGSGAFINGIAFRAVGHKLGDALLNGRGSALHVAGTISIDRWQGAERVQFRVSDVAEPTVN
jgi:single-stranded-DNA-specific exonuclease